jgi:hypothetical protein
MPTLQFTLLSLLLTFAVLVPFLSAFPTLAASTGLQTAISHHIYCAKLIKKKYAVF